MSEIDDLKVVKKKEYTVTDKDVRAIFNLYSSKVRLSNKSRMILHHCYRKKSKVLFFVVKKYVDEECSGDWTRFRMHLAKFDRYADNIMSGFNMDGYYHGVFHKVIIALCPTFFNIKDVKDQTKKFTFRIVSLTKTTACMLGYIRHPALKVDYWGNNFPPMPNKKEEEVKQDGDGKLTEGN